MVKLLDLVLSLFPLFQASLLCIISPNHTHLSCSGFIAKIIGNILGNADVYSVKVFKPCHITRVRHIIYT